jgi:hypothetical protein
MRRGVCLLQPAANTVSHGFFSAIIRFAKHLRYPLLKKTNKKNDTHKLHQIENR